MTTATIKFNSIAQLGEYVTSHQQAGSKLLDTDCITSGEWCGGLTRKHYRPPTTAGCGKKAQKRWSRLT